MIYEIELYINSMSDKTEKITVEGCSFMTTDTIEGALFSVIAARGATALTVPYSRFKGMRLITTPKVKGETIELAGRHKEKAVIS
jgi:hypothetical protein